MPEHHDVTVLFGVVLQSADAAWCALIWRILLMCSAQVAGVRILLVPVLVKTYLPLCPDQPTFL